MVFEKGDVAALLAMGYTEEDIPQIKRAVAKTQFICRGKRISAREARALLGSRQFLSGIARSAFHWSACRIMDNGGSIIFDSSALFKEVG